MTHGYYIQKKIWGYIVQPRTNLTHCKWPQFSNWLDSLIQGIWPTLGKGGLRNNQCTCAWTCGTLQSSSVILIRQFTKVNWVNYPQRRHISVNKAVIPLQFRIQDDNCAAFLSVSTCFTNSSKTQWLSSERICVQFTYNVHVCKSRCDVFTGFSSTHFENSGPSPA